MTAAVPTQVKQQPITNLGFQPDGSVDAVIALGVLAQLDAQQCQQCLRECTRVLKPGMPLVFVEPVSEGGSPLRGLIGVSTSGQSLPTALLESLRQDQAFSYVEWDVALAGQDPHAVGVAVRSQLPLQGGGRQGDETMASKQRRSKQPKTAKGFSGGSSGSGGGTS